jgi:hypothetical protein
VAARLRAGLQHVLTGGHAICPSLITCTKSGLM